MTAITAQMVKQLRDKTGAGMMDCKNALAENNGDMESSVDWLRKKGLAKAAKKAGRVAADGLIGVAAKARKGALVEVNSETDFVARNETFQGMVAAVTELALGCGGNLEKLKAAKMPKTGETVDEHIKELIATIGENMTLRRTAALEAKEGVVASYMHNATKPNLGKIGVIVALESKGKHDVLEAFGRQLAMHIAAANPLAITADELDKSVIERERAVYTEQAQQSGKSPDVIAKMVEGRLRKEFFQQVVLMQQTFVIDGKETVEAAVKAAEKTAGAPIKVAAFVRYALGDGIEKDDTDFAAEVAAMAKR